MAGGAAMAILNLWESCLASCKLPFALAEVCSLMMEHDGTRDLLCPAKSLASMAMGRDKVTPFF